VWSEGNYGFGVRPKGQVHGPPQGMKVNNEIIILQYFDGPATKLDEGETDEISLG